ncbi:OmpA family protein [Loktanella sp. IMCC34160]|uniref:OmpA family protein n=1 Tax=Loktanella sp. IMCC34160 TaxID=2510646 RepID=UPI00101DF130|nr:OmpA family protein [Loktanella sp. IMCC34160]RYG90499.1 OmpA family protein [Loktanella sp. IMCC34160]
MRLSALFLRIAVFVAAALITWGAARVSVTVLEQRSTVAVQEALLDEGQEWPTVIADGLQIILEGEAPSEAARFRAMTISGRIVDASRVIDNMHVTDPEGLAPPSFAIEILRNDSGVSLIGLIPAATDRAALSARITRIADGQPVTDLLESADYPMPENWRPALNYAVDALAQLPRSKISVAAGRVEITAISDSADQKRLLEARLSRERPEGVRLALQITAPRPVISPYITRFTLDPNGARFASCTADTEEARDKIIAAATAAGLEGRVNCTLALGVPSATWSDAVSLSIAAVAELGGGTVTISDADIALVALEGTEQSLFDSVVGALDNNLPDLFALDATLPVAPEASEQGPTEFVATLSPEGLVQLRGKISDDLMNQTVENYAQARFGRNAVRMGTLVTDGLPRGWALRVLAGIEGLSYLSNGSVVVSQDNLTLRGNTGDPDASAEVSRLLIEKLGEAAQFSVDVTYVEALDPIAALPTPEECIAQIGIVTAERKILFDPGSDSLTADTQPVIDDIAEVLRACLDIPMEIAGYTDSQGREEMNLALSKNRAEAVLSALRARRVPTGGFVANGYGEADPIADNETEEGREANRRIEFRLLQPEPTPEVQTALEAAEDAPAEETSEDAPQDAESTAE